MVPTLLYLWGTRSSDHVHPRRRIKTQEVGMLRAVLPASTFQTLISDVLEKVFLREAVKLDYHRHDTLLHVLSARLNYTTQHASNETRQEP